ncbi:hypothetical protein RhiirC2_774514 [Rhizophagus irregularis]|uniref:Uncharacterized protein n=1 Tax=Rhizophagus irregularis TaxID=588596 RepID=A0A2N1NL55_9GLOM|nr:hypothetical protein RhiirC2_774514 [Rhizophagus irregularis]
MAVQNNLGIALKRSNISFDSELIFKNLGIIEDIRNASSFNQTLSEELKMVIKSTQKTLKIRTERLKLKNQKFKCIEPAILKEINGLFEILGEKIHNTITQNGTSQNKLRTYIKKCRESDCLICDSVQLPHEIFNQLHYIPDPQILSSEQNTTEKDIPSK